MSCSFSAKLCFVFEILRMQKTTRFSLQHLYKVKQKPATKIQDHVFLLHRRPHAKNSAHLEQKKSNQNCHLFPFMTSFFTFPNTSTPKMAKNHEIHVYVSVYFIHKCDHSFASWTPTTLKFKICWFPN